MAIYLNIGKFIRDKREYKHLTVAKLAEMSDTSVTGLENIELGDADPKWSTLQRILKALNIDAGDLKACIYGKELISV